MGRKHMGRLRNVAIMAIAGVAAVVAMAVAPAAQATTMPVAAAVAQPAAVQPAVAQPVVEQPAVAQPVAWDDLTGAPLAAWDCNSGNVCFWDGFGGTGGRCMWSVADPDWTSGSIACSWATTANVKSVYNAGTSSASGVAYYKNTGYNNRVGCTRQGKKGDLAGTYQLRSHQWISGSCG